MEDKTYGGWTNEITWRVNIDFRLNSGNFIGYDAKSLETHVKKVLAEKCGNVITKYYAMEFIKNVNWEEIAGHIEND